MKLKTVFIVGAGASAEVGFPLGWQLRDAISQNLRFQNTHIIGAGEGNQLIFECLHRKHKPTLDWVTVCVELQKGILLSDSVDDYIYAHQDPLMTECAKVAISHLILEAERGSRLFVNSNKGYSGVDFSHTRQTWYDSFARLLTKSRQKTNRAHIFENVAIICFNYDRSIEQYLTHHLATHYRISIDESADIVRTLSIFRPYGSVGPYSSDHGKPVSYGHEVRANLSPVAENIRTYSEQISDGVELSSIHKAMDEAEQLVFLGMGFHKNNMDILRSRVGISPSRIFATRKGISNGNWPIIQDRIRKLWNQDQAHKLVQTFRIHEAPTCRDLFDEYALVLAE